MQLIRGGRRARVQLKPYTMRLDTTASLYNNNTITLPMGAPSPYLAHPEPLYGMPAYAIHATAGRNRVQHPYPASVVPAIAGDIIPHY